MSEQSIENKQKYLRDKILLKGHDAEAFMGFCQQHYGQIDLEGWSFSKLRSIVKCYLGDKAEQTFTQQQLDNQQCLEFVENLDSVQQPKEPAIGVINPVIEEKQLQKKQIVFSDLDWGIFGLSSAPVSSTNSTFFPLETQSHKNTNFGAAITQYDQFNFIQPYKKKQQQTDSMSPPSQLFARSDRVAHLQTSHEGFPIVTNSIKEEMIKEKIYESNQPKKGSNKEIEDLKVQDIIQVIPGTKISQAGSFQVNVIASKHLPPLPSINEIKIIKTEQKTRNFLQGDYTLYHIQFYPCNHIIQRKFNDFRKLRAILQKIYPYVRLPYLEPQGWIVNSSEAKDLQTLNKYKYMIVQFLKYITIRNELLRKSKIVRIFIGMIQGSPTDFKKYQNIVKPKTFSQLCLPNGKLNFYKYDSLSPIDKYMTNIQLLSGNIDTCYQKLRKSLQTLFYNYDQVLKSLTEVGSIFETLQSLIQKFNFDNDNHKDLRVYDGVKQVCLKMKQEVQSHYGIFKNQIQTLFKYERENMTTFKQVNEIRLKMFNQYCKQGLHNRKQSQLVSKGETLIDGSISIQQPCKTNKNILSIQNMFWGHFTLENAQEYWSQLRFKINQRLTLIAYQQLDNENKNLNFWNNVIKKCVI